MGSPYRGPWEYFVRKVRIGLPNECWEWKGCVGKNGYGGWGIGYQRRNAHRAVYELFYGPIKEGQVNHTCDNKRCCNPDHLYLGNQHDNMRDVVERGLFSNQKGKSSLNPEKIREIRNLLRRGISLTEVGKRYGVTKSAISSIKRGVSWAWVED